MANYGCRGAYIAPFSGEEPTDGTMPTYEEAIKLPKVNQVADSLTNASGSWFGDDSKAFGIDEFSGGEVSADFVDIQDSTLIKVLGAATEKQPQEDNPGITYGIDDTQPYCGFGFISKRLGVDGKVTFQVIFYPKVKGKLGSKTYKTKEGSVNVTYSNLLMDWLAANCGKFKGEKSFPDEQKASAYLAGLFSGTSYLPGMEPNA